MPLYEYYVEYYLDSSLSSNLYTTPYYLDIDDEYFMPIYDLFSKSGASEPTRDGYKFVGWSRSSTTTILSRTYSLEDAAVAGETSGGELSVYAVWKSAIPTITFNANSGTFPTSGESQTTYNSTELTGSTALSSIVETPTKPGYVFKGWSTASTGSVQYTQASMPTISSDTTLYAIYEPDTTKVLLEKGAVDIILGKLK